MNDCIDYFSETKTTNLSLKRDSLDARSTKKRIRHLGHLFWVQVRGLPSCLARVRPYRAGAMYKDHAVIAHDLLGTLSRQRIIDTVLSSTNFSPPEQPRPLPIYIGIPRTSFNVQPALRILSPPKSCTSSCKCRNKTSRQLSMFPLSSAGVYDDGSAVYLLRRARYLSIPAPRGQLSLRCA